MRNYVLLAAVSTKCFCVEREDLILSLLLDSEKFTMTLGIFILFLIYVGGSANCEIIEAILVYVEIFLVRLRRIY